MLTKSAQNKMIKLLTNYKRTLKNRRIPNHTFDVFITFQNKRRIDSTRLSISSFLYMIENEELIPDFHADILTKEYTQQRDPMESAQALLFAESLNIYLEDRWNDFDDPNFANFLKIEFKKSKNQRHIITPDDFTVYSFEDCYAFREDGSYFPPHAYLELYEGKKSCHDLIKEYEPYKGNFLENLTKYNAVYFWHNLEQPIDVAIKELEDKKCKK